MDPMSNEITCIQCGRRQNAGEGLWMFCLDCGTFRCPSCYGNPFETSNCYGCEDRVEGNLILEFLAKAKEEALNETETD